MHESFIRLVITFAVLLVESTAQQPPRPPAKHVAVPSIAPRSEDVSSIDGMLNAYYAVISGPAGKPREWGRDRTLYIPGIHFVIFEPGSDGNTAAHVLTHQEFVDTSDGEVVAKGFYEREAHRVVHRYGNVVHVFSTSEMRQTPAGPVLGRSLDSLEMFWDGHRWWITNANIWPKESPGSPLPREFQPEKQP